MNQEHTLSIIKPDAVSKNHIGEILSRFEKGGLRIIGAKMKHLTRKEAEGFYAVHKERPFFKDLVPLVFCNGPFRIFCLPTQPQMPFANTGRIVTIIF